MRTSWMIVLGMVSAACGALPKSSETLVESVRSYNDGVRWGRYTVAVAHVPGRQRASRLDEWDERAHDVKITDYDVEKVDQKGDREARVQIKLEWYRASDGTVHETHAVQTWERHDKTWLVVDEARLRGTEMPGLPEPIMTDAGGK